MNELLSLSHLICIFAGVLAGVMGASNYWKATFNNFKASRDARLNKIYEQYNECLAFFNITRNKETNKWEMVDKDEVWERREDK
jgi:hypothetical protein